MLSMASGVHWGSWNTHPEDKGDQFYWPRLGAEIHISQKLPSYCEPHSRSKGVDVIAKGDHIWWEEVKDRILRLTYQLGGHFRKNVGVKIRWSIECWKHQYFRGGWRHLSTSSLLEKAVTFSSVHDNQDIDEPNRKLICHSFTVLLKLTNVK